MGKIHIADGKVDYGPSWNSNNDPADSKLARTFSLVTQLFVRKEWISSNALLVFVNGHL